MGMSIAPVPAIVPPLHVESPPMLSGSEPLSVPPCMVSDGSDCVVEPSRISVPLDTVNAPTDVGEVMVVLPPLHFVAPVTLYVPLTLFDPVTHCTVPAPLIVDAASHERESLLPFEKLRFDPLTTLSVAPVEVTLATLKLPLFTANVLPLFICSGTLVTDPPVPPVFSMVPLLVIFCEPLPLT